MGLLVVIALGIVSIRLLPISLIPELDVPVITIQLNAPTRSAREIDETMLRQLRQNLMQINSLEKISSEASDGSGLIRMEFTQGSDMDYIFIEANEKVDRSMGTLKGIDRPKVLKSAASDIPSFYINLSLKDSNTDFMDLSTFASEVIAKRMEQLPEVAMVDVSGLVMPELLIVPDEAMMRQTGLKIDDFESLVKSADINLGSLTIRDGEYRYNVKFQSFVSDKEDIENICLNHNGRIFRLKELATVVQQPAMRSGLVRSDGKEAISLAVIKQSDVKMADLRSGMKKLMKQFSKDYPELDFETTRDQTELLEYSINNLIQNIIVGILLACIVIFLFMQDFRSPLLVALTIPTALIFSMLIFFLCGLTINIISLSGLLLGVGMMVDNTIVLTDNITARWNRGDSLRTAVLKGTSEVRGAMLSSVLTTCAVFIPLVFVSGTAGAMFYDQALAVSIVLLTAYIVTITVIPVYYWCWYKKMPAFKPSPLLSKFSFNSLERIHEVILDKCFAHKKLCKMLFLISAVGSVLALIFIPKTKLPEITYTDCLAQIEWNQPLSLEQNTDRVMDIEHLVRNKAVQVTSLVGTQQFVLSHHNNSSHTGATIYIKADNASALEDIKNNLNVHIKTLWPEALLSFETSGNIFDMVFADKEDMLQAHLRPISRRWVEAPLLDKLINELSAEIPALELEKPSMKKNIVYVADAELMALYGVSTNSLLKVLQNALNENRLFTIIQGNRTLPVLMGVDRKSLEDIISESFVNTKEKDEIPVSLLMKQTWEEDFKTIISGAEGNYYPLTLNFSEGDAKDIMRQVRDIVSANGDFEVDFSGSYFSNIKMVKELLLVLIISIVLLYLILASQFESLIQPIVILSEIVIDIFFALMALWACGISINLMSLIGLIVVCGIVINDSILKIDTINKLRKDGMRMKEAIKEAGRRRLKAIIMTSLTTILSVCPFLARGSMGDDLQYPMSVVIIAGMVAGTLISLFIVPLLYNEIYAEK